MTGDARFGAARLGCVESMPGMAGVALGGYRVALHAGHHPGFGLVDKVLGLYGAIHRQHMAGETVTGFVAEFSVLFFMAGATQLGCREMQPSMIGAVTVGTADGVSRLRSSMAAGPPVRNDTGRDPFMAANALGGLEATLNAFYGAVERIWIPIALYRLGRPQT